MCAHVVLLLPVNTGVAYTSECFPCRPGWFSSVPGSSSCQPCPSNTFSIKGASSCTPCPNHHYSRTYTCNSMQLILSLVCLSLLLLVRHLSFKDRYAFCLFSLSCQSCLFCVWTKPACYQVQCVVLSASLCSASSRLPVLCFRLSSQMRDGPSVRQGRRAQRRTISRSTRPATAKGRSAASTHFIFHILAFLLHKDGHTRKHTLFLTECKHAERHL